jgi:AraC family transcriptional regulator of adaptative response/methylated-DNA-[protein]-cysteine methyltransferase
VIHLTQIFKDMSEQQILDYNRVEKAIEFIAANQASQPSLDEISRHINLSPFHLQRLFTNWAGITPKKFLQYLTLEKSRERLALGSTLEETAQWSGLSGTSRLHDLFIRFEGMTPGQYRDSGRGVEIYYNIYPSLFGNLLLGVTSEGAICYLSYNQNSEMAISEMQTRWKNATLIRDKKNSEPVAKKIFNPAPGSEIPIFTVGTDFQLKVWEALLKIPFGKIASYQLVAEIAGNPKALQAVGSAIGNNPIAYLIPCHRVIRKAGNINQYRWGAHRKMAMIGWEACISGEQ